ncbi:hypothetical protein GCM10023156_23210 [Novipirellula rosea]|uniref:Uncharacterized protein n=1 Tax=Novipirellula rosea TaxID=1031540 RepID=A0ABP8MMZ4_9BACT
MALIACLSVSTIAYSAWYVNGDGTGFVGKGDVQLVYGWNNAQLQTNAGAVTFRALIIEQSEVSWECTNANNEKIQERSRTTTTTIGGLLSSVTRVKNQVTGFNLEGFNGAPNSSSVTEGPKLNSCPAPASTWSLTTPAGDPVAVGEATLLEVSINGTTWAPLN